MSDPARASWRVNRTLSSGADVDASALSPSDPRVPALIRRMTMTGQDTDACLSAGALPMQVHFYSPVPDIADLRRRKAWKRRSPLTGIEFREAEQLAFLRELAGACAAECDWPLAPTANPHQFHRVNSCFSYGCAAILHSVESTRKPRRAFEIGSGLSSRVIAAALAQNSALGAKAEYVITDPEPKPTIESLPGLTRLIPERRARAVRGHGGGRPALHRLQPHGEDRRRRELPLLGGAPAPFTRGFGPPPRHQPPLRVPRGLLHQSRLPGLLDRGLSPPGLPRLQFPVRGPPLHEPHHAGPPFGLPGGLSEMGPRAEPRHERQLLDAAQAGNARPGRA